MTGKREVTGMGNASVAHQAAIQTMLVNNHWVPSSYLWEQ